MDRSLLSFIAGAIMGTIITIILSLGMENWSENPTMLVLGITSTASKIWLIFYFVQLLPVLVISGLHPLQEKFKIKRLVPLSFGTGQATVMVIVIFFTYIVDLFT
jgi:hypothetical protein